MCWRRRKRNNRRHHYIHNPMINELIAQRDRLHREWLHITRQHSPLIIDRMAYLAYKRAVGDAYHQYVMLRRRVKSVLQKERSKHNDYLWNRIAALQHDDSARYWNMLGSVYKGTRALLPMRMRRHGDHSLYSY